MSAAGYAQFNSSGGLYVGAGTGVFYTTPPISNVTTTVVNWTSQTAGQETLVGNLVLSPPGGKPVVFSWDRAALYNSNPDSYPTTQNAYTTNGIVGGWSADYANSSPSTMVMLAADNNGGAGTGLYLDMSGISTNGGQTWTPFGPTSSSSVSIGTGSKTWTTAAGLSINTGDTIMVYD